jgi:hypothetical protein
LRVAAAQIVQESVTGLRAIAQKWYNLQMSGFALNLEWDQSQIAVFRAAKLERGLTRAVSRAGSDAIRAMRVASSRQVRARKRFKVSRVNRAMTLRVPDKGASLEALVWRMPISGEPVPLVEYPYRQVRKGVSVAVNKGKRVLVKGAFVATMRSGHTGIFRRDGKARLPIHELFSTNIAHVFGDTGMVPAVQRRASEVFSATLNRLLPLELAKK